MNEQQLQQLVQGVAQALSQGADPNQVMQQLVQQGVPEDAAGQIIETAMQMAQGGEQGGNMNGTMNTEREAQGVIESSLQELGPEVLFALLQAYDALQPPNKQALLQQLSQMSQQGRADANSGQQPQEANELEKNMFGGR